MAQIPDNTSLTENTYDQIRRDLIACRLMPGVRLKTNILSEKLGVSLGVIREALSRLTAEGFVLAEPQRGFRATPLSLHELDQLSDATITLEAICLRRAVLAGDLEWEIRVTAAHYRLRNTPLYDEHNQTRINRRFPDAYAEFRRALVSGCDNPWLLRIREMLHVQVERYRQICMLLGPKDFDYRKGYPAVVDAALAHDADRAVTLLTERLQTNLMAMRKALESSNQFSSSLTKAGMPPKGEEKPQ